MTSDSDNLIAAAREREKERESLVVVLFSFPSLSLSLHRVDRCNENDEPLELILILASGGGYLLVPFLLALLSMVISPRRSTLETNYTSVCRLLFITVQNAMTRPGTRRGKIRAAIIRGGDDKMLSDRRNVDVCQELRQCTMRCTYYFLRRISTRDESELL